MSDITRRRVLQSGGAAGLLLMPGVARAEAAWNGPPPESRRLDPRLALEAVHPGGV